MKRIIALSLLILLSLVGTADTQGTFPGVIPVGGPVNILAFGADPTNAKDSTAAIQAAIDVLLASNPGAAGNIRTVYCPDGNYKTTLPIFLDPPGNLRGADGVHGQAYNSAAAYNINETVNSGGIGYVSIQNGNLNNTPVSSPTFWRPINWSSGRTYAAGDRVRFNGVPWQSLSNGNLNNTPSTSSSFWKLSQFIPNYFAFGYAFAGNPGLPAAPFGCTLNVQFDNGVMFWVGTGNGMMVQNVYLNGANLGNHYRGQFPGNGVGFCVAGGNGGANRTLFENAGVGQVYTAWETGCNGETGPTELLGAETSWHKVQAANCAQGIVILSSQNDINDVNEPSISCVNNFTSFVGPGIAVHDGNISVEFSAQNHFGISSTSAITAVGSQQITYTFSATIASPDTFMTGCPASVASPSAACVYDVWTILTPHFGPIPLQMTAWNSGTNVATFQILQSWGDFYYGRAGYNVATSTDLQTELQAATTIYATEHVNTFQGTGFNVRNIHLENAGVCTTLFNDLTGIAGDRASTFESVRFNYSVGQGAAPADVSFPAFLCQESYPFINIGSGAGNFKFNNNEWDGPGTNPITIDDFTNIPNQRCVFDVQGTTGVGQGLHNVVVRIAAGGTNVDYTTAAGGCEFADWPYDNGAGGNFNTYFGIPFWGYRPRREIHPRIGSDVYTTLQSITSGNALYSYPVIDGSTIYAVADVLNPAAAKFVQAPHQNFSYGQDLTTSNIPGLSWAYKGQSCWVLADGGTLGVVFPGLGITLDNGGGPVHYIVRGVFPQLSLDGGTHPGFFTIATVPPGGPLGCGVGNKTTVYTGNTIGQDPYVWKTITLQ